MGGQEYKLEAIWNLIDAIFDGDASHVSLGMSKWKKLRRETGCLAPGKMYGHMKRVLSGAVRTHQVGTVHLAQTGGRTGFAGHQNRSAGRMGLFAVRRAEL
jgi:hypothetical protein